MDTRQKILFAAVELFADHGYQGTSINQILKRSDLTKGGFYHFFDSKETLFRQCVNRFYISYLKKILKRIRSTEGSVYERLNQIAEIGLVQTSSMIDELESTGTPFKNYYLFLLESLQNFPYIKKQSRHYYRELRQSLEDIIREGIDEGKLEADLDPEVVAFEMVASTEGAVLLWLVDEEIDLSDMQQKIYDRINASIFKKHSTDDN